MKKLIILFMICGLISCDTENENIPNNHPDEVEVPENPNENEEENNQEYIYDFLRGSFNPFYGLKLDDYSGFELHPLIENKDFNEEFLLEIDGYAPLLFKDGEIYTVSPFNYPELILFNPIEIINQGSSITSIATGDDKTYLIGFKNKIVWIGEFNTLTKEQIDEWFLTDLDRNITVHLGYGEYENKYIDKIQTTRGDAGEAIFLNLLFDNQTIGFYKIQNGNILKINLPFDSYSSVSVCEWPNDKFLVYRSFRYPSSPFYSYEYHIVNHDGIIENSYIWKVNEFIIPSKLERMNFISETDWIYFDSHFIYRYSLNNNQRTVWETFIPNLTIKNNSKVDYEVNTVNKDYWEYKIDILDYDGTREKIEFIIDINSGEIK